MHVVLCDQTSRPAVFLVATTAIANITFMDSMASDYLAEFQTAEVLIQGYVKGKAPSIYSKHQVSFEKQIESKKDWEKQ